MDEKRLQEIKERVAALGPGPYEAPLKNLEWIDFFDENYEIYPPLGGETGPVALVPTKELAAFFAHARQDVPDMVVETEKNWQQRLFSIRLVQQAYDCLLEASKEPDVHRADDLRQRAGSLLGRVLEGVER